jgi:hypothetical protein
VKGTLRRDASGKLVETSASQAMDEIAQKLAVLMAEHGPRSVAFYHGTGAYRSVLGGFLERSFVSATGSPIARERQGTRRLALPFTALFDIMSPLSWDATHMRPTGRAMLGALLVVAALAQSACWSPPVANVQPKGEPRLVEGAIVVESVKPHAIIQSLDPQARSITLLSPGEARPVTYSVGPQVGTLERLKAGGRVRATVGEELTVYVRRDGQPPDTDGSPYDADARVLSVDRSYRLLILRFPNGRDETFKVSRRVRLDEMTAGDMVSIRPVQLTALRSKR